MSQDGFKPPARHLVNSVELRKFDKLEYLEVAGFTRSGAEPSKQFDSTTTERRAATNPYRLRAFSCDYYGHGPYPEDFRILLGNSYDTVERIATTSRASNGYVHVRTGEAWTREQRATNCASGPGINHKLREWMSKIRFTRLELLRFCHHGVYGLKNEEETGSTKTYLYNLFKLGRDQRKHTIVRRVEVAYLGTDEREKGNARKPFKYADTWNLEQASRRRQPPVLAVKKDKINEAVWRWAAPPAGAPLEPPSSSPSSDGDDLRASSPPTPWRARSWGEMTRDLVAGMREEARSPPRPPDYIPGLVTVVGRNGVPAVRSTRGGGSGGGGEGLGSHAVSNGTGGYIGGFSMLLPG